MFGPITQSIYGKQDVAGFFEKAAASIPCDGTEDCACCDCIKARQDFKAYCDAFNERWAEHKKANAELATELEGIRARLHVDCGPLCSEHGDPRDTSVNRTITTCYFGCGNAATTTRTRPDGAVKNCPTCADCADLIDEQNYNDAQAERMDPERVR